MSYQARARIALSDPERVIAQVCEHLVEHDAVSETVPGATLIRFQQSVARVSNQGRDNATLIEVSAPTLESLYFMRMAIASHIREFTPEEKPSIEWTGDGQDLKYPPNFRILEVVGLKNITAHMRRITFSGDDVERFSPLEALHVTILIPHPNAREAQWPRIGPDGLIFWENLHTRPYRRKYTVRSVNPASGTLDIDFFLHDAAGPGARFALGAKVGDRIGVIGPGGGGLVEADWYLFAGDETALPAIARMLEHLPEGLSGRVVIEVGDRSEIQPLPSRASIDIEWLCRNEGGRNAASSLPAAIRRVPFPKDAGKLYAWVGCEFAAFREIRSHLRHERGLTRHQHLAVSYWRRGVDGEEQTSD